MSMSGKGKGHPAYVEEIDETGKKVRRTARKEVTEDKPKNERASQKEKDKPSKDSRRPDTNGSSSSSPPKERVELRQTSRDERRMSSSSTSQRKASSKPPNVHQNATTPQPTDIPVRNNARPVLIQQPPQIRTVAQQTPRPSSYHEGITYATHAPPLSSSAYYIAPNSLMPAPSYPPPTPGGTFMTYGNGPTYHPNGVTPRPQLFTQDYFSPVPQQPTRTLVERLGGTDSAARRRLSVYSTGGYDDRGYESTYEGKLPRKSSLRRTKAEIDAEIMPPPRRRGSVRYADEERPDVRHESRSRPAYQDERSPSRSRRPSSKRHSSSYAYGSSNDASIELERNGRRNSYYAPRTPSYPTYDTPANYQDKFQAAEKYQNSVGGPPVRLTAESLKKASRRARAQPTSSHSTRSSGSRDESERQRSSVTTRTTGTNRTGAEEDITIKLKGQGTIKIAGAEIDYDKDTELNIRRGSNLGGGSQRSSDYGTSDERRDRRERISDRSRLGSNLRGSRERHTQGGFF